MSVSSIIQSRTPAPPGASPAAAAFHASAAAKATVTGKAHVLLPSVAMLFLPVVVSIRAVS